MREENIRLHGCDRCHKIGELRSNVRDDGLEDLSELESVLSEGHRDGFTALAIEPHDDFLAGLAFGQGHQRFVLTFLPDDDVDFPMAEFGPFVNDNRAFFDTSPQNTLVHADPSLLRIDCVFVDLIIHGLVCGFCYFSRNLAVAFHFTTSRFIKLKFFCINC